MPRLGRLLDEVVDRVTNLPEGGWRVGRTVRRVRDRMDGCVSVRGSGAYVLEPAYASGKWSVEQESHAVFVSFKPHGN